MTDRIAGLRAAMASAGVDAVVLAAGADLEYLTGYRAMPLERPTLAVVAQEEAVLLIPELEAARLEDPPFDVEAWGETDDPFARVAASLGEAGTVGVSPTMWARFLLELQERLPGRRWSDATNLTGPLRVRKDASEIARLRTAAEMTDSVMEGLASTRFGGSTEREMARLIGDRLLAAGHDTVEFVIVASGPNSASPHHEPGDRIIEPGDVVVCDFGGSLRGYQSDTTRTFTVGDPTQEVVAAHRAVAAAQQTGVRAATVGTPAEAVDRAARSVLEDAGLGEYFVHRLGHGIGLEVHEDPYLVAGNPAPIEPGMVFSIEPGVYIPDRFGIRIEDIVVASAEGPERLNHTSRALVTVA